MSAHDNIPERDEIEKIFNEITEKFDEPVAIGTRCISTTYYRVIDLDDKSLDKCARFVASRIHEAVSPLSPQLFLRLPGGYSFFAERLAGIYSEMWGKGEDVPFEQYLDSKFSNGYSEQYVGKTAVLITDVITTARSSLETHTKATLKGINVICWATLIDRTLGPGPVPVVSALCGEPVRLVSGF
jgi:hypothetical protein